jgi:glycosyltransferase involved in cell wall biosynthesis
MPAMLTRVLLTTDTVGGVWRYSLEIAAGFAARGARVTLVTMGPPPDAAQEAEASAIRGVDLVRTALPLDWLAETPTALAATARSLAQIAARCGAEVVQLHTPALAADAHWPAPVVAVAHSCVGTWWQAVHGGAMPVDLAWRAAAMARGMAAADAVIAPSRSFAAALAARYGDVAPIHAVLNGRRPAVAVATRRQHAFTAGRLWDPGKNVATLDAAAAQSEVFAAGPVAGPNGARIKARHLRLLGSLNDAAMAEQYARAAVFVSVARYEPFGLAVLEAAQSGCALVLSDIQSFRELWDCAALFVDPGDAAGLAATLRGLLASPRRCAALGCLAQQRAASLSAETMIAATWDIHQMVRRRDLRRVAA